MKLFQLSSNIMPTSYMKAASAQAAQELFFSDGFDEKTRQRYESHPSFKCEEITPEAFVDSLPDEFCIQEDTSF